MLEVKVEETEAPKDNNNTPEVPSEEAAASQQTPQPELEPIQPPPPPPPPPPPQECNETALNPLNNEPENHLDTEAKGKQRRYWTPKEEERFFEIWGRENWRLTRHGKNTIFFAKWAEEMKERFNIDVKTEEIQCKVNQTRAKFRSVKKLLENDKNAPKWKKYDLVEKILKNQYRSKDDEPVPLDALENNRDMSPTELLNCETRPSSPSGGNNTEQDINLNQTAGDPQLTDEVNMSNISLSDHNLTSNVFSNTSQSSTNFSTELFGSDQLDIKKEIEADLAQEGYSEFISVGPNEQATTDITSNNGLPAPAIPNASQEQMQTQASTQNQSSPMVQQSTIQQMLLDNSNGLEAQQISALANNRTAPIPIQNHTQVGMPSNNADVVMAAMPMNHVAATTNNHIGAMQPPRQAMVVPAAPSPRKRGGARAQAMASTCPLSQDALENLYLEEVRKKNVILVEQGEINRKRLRLEERKVKLMEEFFPKYLTLQQEILQKLDGVTRNAQDAINLKMEN